MDIKERLQILSRRTVDGKHRQPLDSAAMPCVTCKNCSTVYRGNYCPGCGQSASTHRFTTRQTAKLLLRTFTKFDDTFWHTTAELFYRPGHMIRDYLHGHRAEYLRPLQMLVCLITIYLILAHVFFGGMDPVTLVSFGNGGDLGNKISNPFVLSLYNNIKLLSGNVIVVRLVELTLLSFACYLCFTRLFKYGSYNYAEHFYTLVYAKCQTTIIAFLILPYNYFTDTRPTGSVGFFVELILLMWIYTQLLQKNWRKTLRICLLSILVYIFIAVFIVGLCVAALMHFIDT